MNTDELSKDAEYLLCVIYKRYKSLVDSGTSKPQAKIISGSAEMQRLVPQWAHSNTDDTCRELSTAGYLSVIYASDAIYRAELTDKTIVYMENRFKNNLKELLSAIEQLRNIILP